MSEENENREEKTPTEEENQKIKNILLDTIQQYAENVYTPEQIDEMLQTLEKLQEKTDAEIRQEAEILVKYQMPAEINEKNNVRVDDPVYPSRKDLPEEEKNIELEKSQTEEKEEQQIIVGKEAEPEQAQEIPEDVAKACMKLGITQIKGYFYVNAKQLGEKVDNIVVNQNGGNVLILEVADSSRLGAADRYYGIQDERMILRGTQDEEMEEVTEKANRPPANGKLVEPLKKDNPTYVEFSDSEGMLIQERLEDKMNLSVQDLENYKKEVEKLLDKYSQNVVAIIENPMLEEGQKNELLAENDNHFNRLLTEMTQKYGIDKSDEKSIQSQKKEYVQEKIEKEEEDDEPDPHTTWLRNYYMTK